MDSSVKPNTGNRAVTRVAFACTALVLLLTACGDDGAILPPGHKPALVGIRGRVSAAGRPVSARISALAAADRWGDEVIVCPTDSMGRYDLPLSPGRYFLSAEITSPVAYGPLYYYAADGPTDDSRSADTLAVQDGHDGPRADFPFGSLRLRLHLSEAQLNQVMHLEVCPWLDGVPASYHLALQTQIRAESTVTDVECEPIPAGTWAIELHSGLLGEPLWLPGTWDPRAATVFSVAVDSSLEREFFLDAPVARLHGSVTGSWQAMDLDQPMVSAYAEDSTIVARAWAAADGSWTMQLFSVPRVRLLVTIEGISRWIGGPAWAEATSFALTPGEETIVPPEVESGLLVRLNYEGGWVLHDLGFALVDDTGSAIELRRQWALSDLFPIPNLSQGRYRLQMRQREPGRNMWLPQWFDGATSVESATPIVLPGGGTVVPITLTIEKGGEIRGRLVGNPPGAFRGTGAVFVTPADADSVWGCTTHSHDDSTFVVLGLPDGSYKIGAPRPETYGPYCGGEQFAPSADSTLAWYGGASWASAATVEIRDHGHVDGIEIEVAP
jgi:hypothetical protein